MSRGINATTKASLASDGFYFATLIKMEFSQPSATTIRLTDFGSDLSVNVTGSGAETFTSSSHLLSIGDAAESASLQVNTLTLTMSGVDQAILSTFLTYEYIDAPCRIWRAVIDSSNNVVGEHFVFFDGRIVGFDVRDGGTDSEVEIEIASHWRDFEKINNRKTNSNSQSIHFPGDKGFEFASRVAKDIRWGRKG